MSVFGRVFLNWRKNLGTKVEQFATDTYKVALFTGSYTPALDSDCAYAVAAPAAPTLTQGASGSLGARTEYYKTTFVNPAGESLPSAEQSIAALANNVVTVTAPSNPGGSCTGYNVYAATTSGAEKLQNVSPIAFGVNWVEPNTGLTGTGASPPGSNTADISTSGSKEVAGGSGYTAGGITLASTSWAEVLANSFADVWTGSTAYALGQMVRPASGNGFIYMCVQTGTTGSGAPTWGTTLDGLTTDNTVQWLCYDTSQVIFSAANISWTVTGVISWRYAVMYDSTTNDLVALIDPQATQTGPSSGNININFDSAGIIAM